MRRSIRIILCLGMAAALSGCGSKDENKAGRTFNQSSSVNDVLEAGMSEGADASESVPESEKTSAVSDSMPASKGADAYETAAASDVIPASEGTDAYETAAPDSNASGEAPSEALAQSETEAKSNDTESGTEGMSNSTESGTEGMSNSTESGTKGQAGGSGEYDVDLTQLSSTMVYSEVFSMMMAPEDYVGKTVKMTGLYSYFHDELTDKDYSACVVQDATACCAQGIEFVLTDDYHYPEDYPEIDEEITVTGVFSLYTEGEYTFFTLKNAELL